MKRQLSAIAILASLGIAAIATAATQTANFNVTASVGTSCTIAVPAALAFGTYDPTSPTALNGVTNMNVTCTLAAPASIDISEGAHPAGGSTPAAPARQMSDGGSPAQFLSYALFQDAGRTTIWGGGATAMAITGTGAAQVFPIYGQISALQTATAAAFTDGPVVATITF